MQTIIVNYVKHKQMGNEDIYFFVAHQYSTSNNVQEKIQENSSETIMQYIRQPHISNIHRYNVQLVFGKINSILCI